MQQERKQHIKGTTKSHEKKNKIYKTKMNNKSKTNLRKQEKSLNKPTKYTNKLQPNLFRFPSEAEIHFLICAN